MNRLLISALIILAIGSAGLVWHEPAMGDNRRMTDGSAADTAFFGSPKLAVTAIRKMLREERWASLARYYDLGGSGIDRKSLESGAFFIRTKRPEVAHPGGFWRYKHPFPPAFEYSFATPVDTAGIVTVRVSIEIDQGAGQPAQIGWREFRMRRSEKGFQILPD